MMIGLSLFQMLSHLLSPSTLWDRLISTGYEYEVYDIFNSIESSPASESSTIREQSRGELHVSNKHSDEEADSEDDSNNSCLMFLER